MRSLMLYGSSLMTVMLMVVVTMMRIRYTTITRKRGSANPDFFVTTKGHTIRTHCMHSSFSGQAPTNSLSPHQSRILSPPKAYPIPYYGMLHARRSAGGHPPVLCHLKRAYSTQYTHCMHSPLSGQAPTNSLSPQSRCIGGPGCQAPCGGGRVCVSLCVYVVVCACLAPMAASK